MPRVSPCLIVSPSDQAILEANIRAHTTEQRIVQRSQIILSLKRHQRVDKVAEELGISKVTVAKWRDRYIDKGLEGILDKPRSGRKVTFGNDTENLILEKVSETPPDGLGRWDGPTLERELGIPAGTIWRILRRHGIQLARVRTWCISTDPDFAAKATDIVGLYLAPPENAIVLSVDEKPSIQALSRATGFVQTSNGRIVRAVKSTYRRNGTVNLFAALQIATGEIYGKVTKYKKRSDFLGFMDDLLRDLPDDTDREYHVILDNYCVHKRCDDWLAAHPNVHFHYTPTSASWLNMVEIWFGIMSRKVFNGASFDSPRQLTEAIEKYMKAYNQNNAHPFIWRKREVKGSQLRNTLTNLSN